MTIELAGMRLELDESTLGLSVYAHGRQWVTAHDFEPYFDVDGCRYLFADAGSATHEPYSSGLGEGILSRYAFFSGVEAGFETVSYTHLASCIYVVCDPQVR